jgi:hypothetical protein
LKELESPGGEIYRLWKVLNAIRVIDFVNPTHVGSGVSADSFSTSNAYFEGAVLGFEGGELKWLSGGGGGVSSVGASTPLVSSGGTTPTISIGTTGVATGDVLTYNGSAWAAATPASTNVGLTNIAVGDGTGITGSSDLAYNSGTLSLEVTNTINVTDGGNTATLTSTSLVTDAGTLTVDASTTVQVGGTAAVSIGGAFTMPTADGAAGEVLTTDGAGSLSWAAAGSGSPGGSADSVQFNDGAGGFGGSAEFAWSDASKTLSVTGAVNISGGDPRALVVKDILDATEVFFYDASVEALTVQSSVSTGIVTIDAANINITDAGHTAQLSVADGSYVNVDLYVPPASAVVPTIVAKDGYFSPVPLKLDALEIDANGVQIRNVADGSATGDAVNLGQLSAMPALGASQNIFWLVEGGKYASLAAAYAAAGEGDVILIGPKSSGTWGDVTLSENKTMSFVGLNGVNGKQVQIGAITFSPTTGGMNINRNEHFFSNLMINGSFASQAVLFSGSGAGRMRFAGCYINNTSATGDGIVNSNTYSSGGTTSSIWLDNTLVQITSTSAAAIRQSGQYTFIKNRCELAGGASAIVATAGTVESTGAFIEMNGAGSVVDVSGAGTTVLLGYSTIKNSTTNGSGVTVGAGAALGAGVTTFAVASSAATTIAAGSNGQALPQATINVANTSAFTTSGSLLVTTSAGIQVVTYTGKTPTSFTGCSGGTGTMTTGGAVTQQAGYCVKGTGVFLHSNNIYSNSSVATYNVKIQNTLTALAVTTAFTSSP